MPNTRYDKALSFLSSAFSNETAKSYQDYEDKRAKEEEERIKLEREKRAQEERIRREKAAASLDSFGSMKGMQEALDRPSPEPKRDANYGRLDALSDQFSGGEAYKDAADAFDELGELETKYSTKEQRAEARARLQEDINFYSRDRATFSMAGQANAELRKVEKAEELFSIPGKVEQLKAEVASKLALAGAKSTRADDYYNTTGNYGTRTIGDIAGSHESAWSIAGGLVGGATLGPTGAFAGAAAGSIPAFEVARKAAYMEGSMAGMSEQQAREFSKLMGGSEFVLSTLGQGGAAALSGVLKREAKKRVVDSVKAHVVKTVAKQTLFGGAEEGGTVGVRASIAGSLMDNKEYTDKTKLFLAEEAYVKDGKFDVNRFFSDAAREAAAGAGTSGAVTTPVETLSSMAEAGRNAARLQAYLKDQKAKKEATDLFNQTKPAPTPNTGTFGEQGDLFGGGGTPQQQEDVARGTAVGTDNEGNQGLLRTQAATIRTQLEQDRARLNDFQTRIERAPFAEEGADLLTNQERTDMSRIQQRIAVQERALAEVEAAIVPIQPELPLPGRAQPKNPKFRGDERTVDQVKSDYFKTQPVQGPAPMSPELRKEAQRAKVEELKRTKKEAADADKKAKAQYEAARRKYLDSVRAGLMDLDPDTRASRLAEAAVTWKINNPLVLPSKQAATTSTTNPAGAQAEGVSDSSPWRAYRGGLRVESYSTENIRSDAKNSIDNGYGIYITSDTATADHYGSMLENGARHDLEISAPRHSLLDRDKPLSEQSPQIIDALRSAGLYEGNEILTGKDLYERLVAQNTQGSGVSLSRGANVPAMKAANAQLQAAGIRGMSYVANHVKGKDNTAEHYVIFDGADIRNASTPQATVSNDAAGAQAAPVEGETTVPVSAIDDRLQAAPAASGALPSATSEGGTGVTLDDVSKAIGGGKRDKLASRLSYMVEDGNLEIVQDQSQLPEGMVKQDDQGRGWYDPNTGKTYIVAGNLNKGNVRGDILSVLAHETKHGGDFGGDNIVSRSFSKFIGAEANQKLGAKIRAAAAAGDAGAKEALDIFNSDAYQKRGLTEDQKASELVAAYITVENNKTGARTALYRAVVNPLLTGAKQLVGADLDLKDIHYMADQWVREVASKGERFQPNGSGVALPMVLGFSANNFQDAQDAGRVFQSRNGNYKFVISDKDSTLQQGAPARLVQGEALPLGEVINHPELYDNYVGLPQAIDVKVDPELKGSATKGYWDRNKFTISVSPEAASDASTDPDNFRGLILHEVQHAIQDVEGHPRGGNSDMFKNTPDYDRVKTSRDNTRRLTSALLQGIVHPQLSIVNDTTPTTAMNTIKKLVEEAKKDKSLLASNAKQVASLLEDGVLNEQTLGVISKLNELGNKLELADNAVLTKDNEAFNEYWNLYGEEEARFTQDNRNASLEELPINPEEFMGYGATATYDDNDSYMPLAELAHSDPRIVPTKKAINQIDTLLKQARDNLKRAISLGDKKQIAESTALVERLEGMLEQTNKKLVPMPNAVEQTEQDNRTGGENKKDVKPMPSIVSKATPQDRRTMWTRVKDANTFIRTISNLVSTTDGYMTQVFQLLSNRSSDRATLAYDAERLGADMRDGIKRAAKEQGVSNAQIEEQLSKALEDINKLPTKEARDLAVKNLDNKYPGVGTALVAARNLKWDLARAVIVQRRAEGRDLTQKELNVINKMLDREETWTTRVYESGQPNAKELAKARLARYKKNPNSKEAKQHLEDVEYLRKHYVNIPPKEELLTMKAPALRNFYETWLGDADGVSEVDMVEALADLTKLEPAILQEKLDKVVRELIGLDKPQTKTVRGFAGSRQNRTVLEGRQNIPPEIRRLMGEITGTVAKEVLSIARLSSLYTQNKVLANLAANYKGILWEDYSVGEFTIPVTAENYGPMRGKFVTPSGSRVLQPIVDLGMNAEEALNTINENGANAIAKGIAAVGNKVQKLAGVTKIVSLILNLGAAGANYAGAWGALTANGVGVNKAVAAHKLTLKAIRARYKPNLYKDGDKKDVRDVILSGVLDSATTGEYQQRLFSTIFRDMAEDASPKDVMFKLYNLWNDGLLSAKDFYAFMDMWAKVGAWSDRREMLTKMYEADGTTKTEDEIIREAGHDITAANISWVRAPAIVKATEKYLGPVAMFLVYFAEVPRSVAFSYALVGKDLARANTLKTKEAKTLLRDAAVRRLVGTTLYISGVVAGMAAYLNGMEDDEERRRKTDPAWEQKGLNVVLGKTLDGQDMTFNLLRVDFIGPLNELLVKLATQDEDDTTVGIFKEYATDQFVKNRALFSLMRSVYSLAGKETINMKESDSELVKRLDDLSWGDDTNLGKNLADTVDKFTPAIVRGTINTIKGVTGSNDYKFSVADNPLAAFIQATGLKLTVRDPEKSLEFAVTAYNKEKKEAQKELSGIEKRFGRLTGSDLVNELDDVIEEERKAHKALHEVYDGVTAFNGYYTDKDYAAAARAVLKAKKLGPASNDVVSGSFNVRFVSKDYLNKWVTARQEAIKELPTSERSEASAKLRADVRLVKDYLNSRSK